MPSPSFSNCWKELGCLLSILEIFDPPPRLLTLIEESVRPASDNVPTSVGRKVGLGGARLVKRGSQSTELAVVGRAVLDRLFNEDDLPTLLSSLGFGCAVMMDLEKR